MIAFLQRQGFDLARVKGSHHVISRGDLRTTIPVHGNEPLKIGTLRGVLRDIQMSPSQFSELLKMN